MTIASTEDQTTFAEAIGRWAQHTGVVDVVRRSLDEQAVDDESDARSAVWPGVAELGLFAATAPDERGGLDLGFVDLAVMLEQCGRDLVPGPLVSTAIATHFLSRSGADAAQEMATEMMSGHRGCALAPAGLVSDATPSAVARHIDGGGIVVDAEPQTVVGHSGGGLLLLVIDVDGSRRWAVVDAAAPGVEVKAADAVDGTATVSTVSLRGVGMAEHQILDAGDALVCGALVAGLAAQASGVARWTLDTAVEYAKVREQFGSPIGSFQAVKHICAEMLCRSEQMSAAAWDVAHAVAEHAAASDPDDVQTALSTAVAAAAVGDLAVANAKDCIQILGGIGFTFDHAAHLYLRFALSLRAQLGGTTPWRAATAHAVLGGTRRGIDIDLSEVDDDRAAVRATCEQIAAAADTRRALVDAGYLTPHWPAPFGLGAGAALQLLIDAELDRAGVSRPDLVIGAWAIPTILEHGTAAQRERFVAPTLAGDVSWCQLFSEPEAGSDLASLRTRATRVDGGWTLRGQKVWTSAAQTADWAICLARTDTDVPKHKGISYFLVDMTSAGIDVRPLREITGNALFNEVFLDDVFVPDDCLVGEQNGGWRLARTTLANERVAMGGSGLGAEMESLLGQIATSDTDLGPVDLDALGALCVQAQIGRVMDAQSVLRSMAGHDPGAISSVRKLIGARHRQDVPEFALSVLGPAGLATSDAADLFLRNRCLTIAGGTTQVLATAAAERILGLPRAL
ncbi:acyl-CoA dehydrogenase [Williamsia phyllosphaerae]|uniref:Acyl-CoA dehydrogenase FadE n=1 Tax=Williamsia phyllosphaerae TaxID=885042 RepID=A0ABQ1U179_9NOCA|nr:acyl-CoA dehydrogenase [Williamsia phyllosphaerae]GGF08564.1 putative acyl-CoA dehydrogenase FadE [Williamsia phyllosphaerae]